jgi:hypothetical protein
VEVVAALAVLAEATLAALELPEAVEAVARQLSARMELWASEIRVGKPAPAQTATIMPEAAAVAPEELAAMAVGVRGFSLPQPAVVVDQGLQPPSRVPV